MRKALGVAPAATNDEVTKAYVDAGELFVVVQSQAADFSVSTGSWYKINASAATGAINALLPTGARNGARVIIEVTAGTNTVWPTAQGTDTINPGTAGVINLDEMIEFVSNGAGVWYAVQSRTINTARTMMRRDGAGRAQVVDPVATNDIATKSYVDTAKYFEQGNLNNITLVSGWQNIGTGTTTVYGTEGKHMATATGITTIPFTGVYFMSACVLTATVATAGRCVLQFALTAATGSPIFRAEGSNATNSTAGLNVAGMQRLAAGATLYCQVFASGGFIGAALTGETISVGLMFLSA